MSLPNMTREDLFDDFNLKPGYYSGLAKKNKIALPTLMNRIAPDATPNYPMDAMSEMLARHELQVAGSASYTSSNIEDFLDSDSELGPKETLFWATLERDYDISTSVYDLERKMKLNQTSSLLSDSPEGGAVRPRSTRMLYEANKFRPPLSITDIAGGIETIPGQIWQQADYATPAESERSTTIPEAGNIPLTTLTTSERQGRTKKVGAGLRVSREFELNATLMSEVRMWVRRQGMRDEIRIVNEGVNLLKDSAPSMGVSIGSSTSLGMSATLKIGMHFGSESGYMLDTLLGLKSSVETFILGVTNTGTANVLSDMPYNFSSQFGGIELINAFRGPTRMGYLDVKDDNDPNKGVKLDERELVGMDSRWALVLYRQARGVTNENRYDPASQVRDYFLTQRFGWHLQDKSALARFTWTV